MKNGSKEDRLFLEMLGRRIREIRKEKKMTQAELGFHVDMEKSNINRIEKGGTNPTILTLKKICTALEIELDDLFTQPSSIGP